MKQRTIQQLKEQLNNQKVEEAIQQYERACKDLNVKEKIIEDMRMTLEEQEQTQVEQDQVLEAKLEEVERLATELEKWKENAMIWKPKTIKGQIKNMRITQMCLESSVIFKMSYRSLNRNIMLIERNG